MPLGQLGMLAIGVLLLVVVIRLLLKPLRCLGKLVLHIVFGFIALFVFNFLGGFFGLALGISWLNAIIAGILGVPGIILLLIVKYII